MDDLFAVLATENAEIHDTGRAVAMHRLEHGTYHKNLELECEDTSIPFKYLCSEVHTDGNEFNITYSNKNLAHFTGTGTQLFPCFQHWHSYTPRKQKLAIVISTSFRIARACNSWTNLFTSVSNIKNELLSLKYPLHVLLRAVGRMATTDARWVTIGGAWRATHGNGDDIENEF